MSFSAFADSEKPSTDDLFQQLVEQAREDQARRRNQAYEVLENEQLIQPKAIEIDDSSRMIEWEAPSSERSGLLVDDEVGIDG